MEAARAEAIELVELALPWLRAITLMGQMDNLLWTKVFAERLLPVATVLAATLAVEPPEVIIPRGVAAAKKVATMTARLMLETSEKLALIEQGIASLKGKS